VSAAGRGSLAPALPAAIAIGVLFAAPLVAFAVYSVLTGGLYEVTGPATLENFDEVLGSTLNRVLARNSLIVGVAAAAVTTLAALPVAYWLRYTQSRLRNAVLFLIVASFLASYLVRIYAWRSILGEQGLLNSLMVKLPGIDSPLSFLIYNRFAVVVALVHIFLPYVALLIYAGLRPLTPAYLEAAQDLGAGAWQRWRHVILPVVAAPAASAFVFVFVLSASDYVTPQFLGGTNGTMLGVQIQASMTATGDYALGAALAVSMLIGFLVLYAIVAALLRVARLNDLRLAA
jgi:spermidine/putrescine transport system permease protein